MRLETEEDLVFLEGDMELPEEEEVWRASSEVE